MQTFATVLLVVYLAVIAVVCAYGVHRYWMVWTFLRHRRRGAWPRPAVPFQTLPRVTIQLPMFNERRVAQRVIEAACAMNYPRDLLQVQVLDDSTDDSAAIARRCCQRMFDRGHNVQYLHRTNREGFKAGALAHAMSTATGEFIAIFDADFVPPPDFLHKTIHQFSNPKVGMTQVRWSHLTRNDSLLTQVQAMYLDGHFVVEQAARAASGRWFNFNGTAGIWRRAAIESAGGWHHDTLTEDTDLSYRAQLAGWDFCYLPEVCCPAEVPPTIGAFLSQQHRWNKGLVQTAIKLLPRILASDAPLRNKIEAWFHLTAPVVHVFILMLVVLVTPAMFVQLPIEHLDPIVDTVVGSVFLILGAIAAGTFYMASQRAQGLGFWRTILRLPALMALGVGISVANSRAVLEAALGRKSPFVRTPKYNGDSTSDIDPIVHDRKRLIPNGMIEVALGSAMAATTVMSCLQAHTIVATPFLVLFSCGYFAVGWPQLRETLNGPRRSLRCSENLLATQVD